MRPSETMRGLYREIAKTANNIQTDLDIIKDDLRERENTRTAFCCDYEVFKDLYRLKARAMARTGQSVFIGLFTITDAGGGVPGTKILAAVMDLLIHSVCSGLRRGDVVSRFSPTQYVVMLPALTYENGLMVLDRISKRFSGECHNKGIVLHTALQPLDPAD